MPRIFAAILSLLAATLFVAAVPPAASPEGRWLTAGHHGVIEIYRCGGGALCGRIAWFRIDPNAPNPQGLDLHNPDPARRDQSLCGLTLMNGFRAAGPDDWEDGAVYDPESGNSYHATMRLDPDGTLRLRGYIGISLFGRSEVWTRFTERLPSCPTR
ncbi:MAG TPA: DUF2147 domain-containing protein [Stellaceae bacterium]|nr:DUF2147 domain-containing protein [Stellaceae bacterium]